MTAIVLVGHGSDSTDQTAEPVYAHAERIRERTDFEEVCVAFWRQTPSIRRVLRRINSPKVVVVPVMMSTGYFVDVVFPRELRLTDEQALTVDKTVWYTEPIGSHPWVSTAIQNRIHSITIAARHESNLGVALVGHGTHRHDESSVTTYTHAERLRDQSSIAEVHSLFLDEQPRVTNLEARFTVDDIIVIPLFIADGTHTTEDIPNHLGIEFRTGPQTGRDGKTIWYSGAIGTDPLFTDIAVELAESAVSRDSPSVQRHSGSAFHYSSSDVLSGGNSHLQNANESFINWLCTSPTSESDQHTESSRIRTWGELIITTQGEPTPVFAIHHMDDAYASNDTLPVIESKKELRERIRYSRDNSYRPLLAAETLPSGWIMKDLSPSELPRIIDEIYPGSIVDWYRERSGVSSQSTYQSITDRYSGIYSSISSVPPNQVEAVKSKCCDNCVKHPTWQPVEDSNQGNDNEGEIPCPEPCPIFIETARQIHDSPATVPSGSDEHNAEPTVASRVFDETIKSDSTCKYRPVNGSRTKS